MEISKEYFAEISNKVATLREEVRTLTARIQELETTAGDVTVQLNPAINPADEPNIVIDRKDVIALAALLNKPPLEKE